MMLNIDNTNKNFIMTLYLYHKRNTDIDNVSDDNGKNMTIIIIVI